MPRKRENIELLILKWLNGRRLNTRLQTWRKCWTPIRSGRRVDARLILKDINADMRNGRLGAEKSKFFNPVVRLLSFVSCVGNQLRRYLTTATITVIFVVGSVTGAIELLVK